MLSKTYRVSRRKLIGRSSGSLIRTPRLLRDSFHSLPLREFSSPDHLLPYFGWRREAWCQVWRSVMSSSAETRYGGCSVLESSSLYSCRLYRLQLYIAIYSAYCISKLLLNVCFGKLEKYIWENTFVNMFTVNCICNATIADSEKGNVN